MKHFPITSVIFPIKNGMYDVNILAKHLNELVVSKRIQAWHPGRWIDKSHRQIEIGFECLADAQLAEEAQGEW